MKDIIIKESIIYFRLNFYISFIILLFFMLNRISFSQLKINDVFNCFKLLFIVILNLIFFLQFLPNFFSNVLLIYISLLIHLLWDNISNKISDLVDFFFCKWFGVLVDYCLKHISDLYYRNIQLFCYFFPLEMNPLAARCLVLLVSQNSLRYRLELM